MSDVATAKLGMAIEPRATSAAAAVPQSKKKDKRIRILTNREFKNGYESIEWDAAHQQFFWYAEESGMVACFPCDLEFAAEKFIECGRVLDPSKLPKL